jgi:hypothetical protein
VKLKKYIKPVLFTIAALGYLDIVLNPNKGFHFLISNKSVFQFIVASFASLSLIILIVGCFKNFVKNVKRYTQIVHLISSGIILNEIFFSFSFLQLVDFLIVLLLALPIPIIINDLFATAKSDRFYFIPIGLFLASSTFLFFKFSYNPYEAYWEKIPIMFMHFWIRNWLIFIGINLILIGVLRKNNR